MIKVINFIYLILFSHLFLNACSLPEKACDQYNHLCGLEHQACENILKNQSDELVDCIQSATQCAEIVKCLSDRWEDPKY